MVIVAAAALLPAGAGGQNLTLTPKVAEVAPREPGTTIMLTYSAVNSGTDSMIVVPSVILPYGWSLVAGASEFRLAPGEHDVWVVGVSIPSRAYAGEYSLRVAANPAGTTGGEVIAQRINVTVITRRALRIALVDQPLYAVEGGSYSLVFEVQNTGNGPADVRMSPTSSLKSRLTTDSVVTLHANETRGVKVHVDVRSESQITLDDVIELRATDAADDSVSAMASSRVTVVQRAGAGVPNVTVPAELRLRAATAATGVAPFELIGGGRWREHGADEIHFVFRGATGLNSVLGEQQENRVELSGAHYRARGGDNYFILSPLMSGGQRGFGGGLELNTGFLSGGGYSQTFQKFGESRAEQGAFVRFSPGGGFSGPQLALNFVNRAGGTFSGRIGSGSLKFGLPLGTWVDAELARSASSRGPGSATSVRLTGGGPIHYDFAHLSADSGFAGPARNSQNDNVTIWARPARAVRFNLTANRSSYRALIDTVHSRQVFEIATVGATLAERLTLEYSGSRSAYSLLSSTSQRVVRARLDQNLPRGSAWLSIEKGMRADSSARASSSRLTLGVSVGGRLGSASLFSELNDGGDLAGGAGRLATFGGNGVMSLPWSNTVSLLVYTSATSTQGVPRYAQADVRITHELWNGSTVSLRGRGTSSAVVGMPMQRLVYLEYGMPLHLPVGKGSVAGGVKGRVLDAETGKGIEGALVRVGPVAGVTDFDGRVELAGLAPGHYSVSLVEEASVSNSAFTGTDVVVIDSLSHNAPDFRISVSPASELRGVVREYASVRTSISGDTDSLEVTGPVAGIRLVLIGIRDTLYETTGINGTFSFRQIPRGEWMIYIADDAPKGFQFDRKTLEFTASSGSEATFDIRMLPKKKRVQIIGDSVGTPPNP